jgi:hypothetical protein
MKKSLFLLLAVVVVVGLAGILPAAAQGVKSRPYTSTITLQNPTGQEAAVQVLLYDGSGNSYTYATTVAAHAAPVINLATVATTPALSGSFSGGMTITSDRPVVAINLMRDSASPNDYDMGIYSGFSSDQVGNMAYLPAMNNAYSDQTSILGVQNIEGTPNAITIRYYNRVGGTLSCTKTDTLPAYAGRQYDASTVSCDSGSLPVGWTGAAVVTAAGKIATVVHQPYLTQNKAVDFEGSAAGAEKLYLPSAFQTYVGQTSNIAVQNVSPSTLSAVTVTFYSTAGAVVGYTRFENMGPNTKASTRPNAATWWDSGVPVEGYIGSAIVTSPDGPVVAVVNITSVGGANIAAAFNGVASGCANAAVPYVRWYSASTAYRTYIAVQNVGEVSTEVIADYYDRNGNLAGSASIASLAPGSKWNTRVDGTTIPVAQQPDWQGTVVLRATAANAEISAMVQAKRNDGMQASNFSAPCYVP